MDELEKAHTRISGCRKKIVGDTWAKAKAKNTASQKLAV
ncbi:hypothetical protein PI125_g403 [Phytophthora idaei]|nr:hypothetical protein PI125_g403 [Phytophthora idaei]